MDSDEKSIGLNDRGPKAIDLLLIEYKALREEVLTTMSSRNQILTFGLGALGLLVGGIFTNLGSPGRGLANSTAVIGVLAFGVPGVATWILYLWLAEFTRMSRAGVYIKVLETRLNELVGRPDDYPPLNWERTIWSPEMKAHFINSRLVVEVAFGILAATAPVLAIEASRESYRSHWWAVMPWFPLLAITPMSLIFHTYFSCCLEGKKTGPMTRTIFRKLFRSQRWSEEMLKMV